MPQLLMSRCRYHRNVPPCCSCQKAEPCTCHGHTIAECSILFLCKGYREMEISLRQTIRSWLNQNTRYCHRCHRFDCDIAWSQNIGPKDRHFLWSCYSSPIFDLNPVTDHDGSTESIIRFGGRSTHGPAELYGSLRKQPGTNCMSPKIGYLI